MPVADAGVRLPWILPDALDYAAFNVEDTSSRVRVLTSLSGIDRLNSPAVPLCILIVKMGYKRESPFLERNMAVTVEQVRLVLVDQVFDPREPMPFPCLGNTFFVPRQLCVDLFDVMIEIRVFRSAPSYRTPAYCPADRCRG
jgi:hypothetical protein